MKRSATLFSRANLIPWLIIIAGLLLAFTKPIYSAISPADLEVSIREAPVVMPSVYKVYANSEALEGKYSLFKLVLTNNSSHTAENVEVSYEIPNIVQSTVFQKIPKIIPGQTVVVNCYPSLPASIVERTTSSKENVNVVVKGANIKTIENSYAVQFKGRNEFVYSFIPADEIRTAAESFDNKELLSCLVTPEDPIIKYLTQKIQEKILKGETASVTNKEEEGVRVMLGIYEATLRSHMVYSGTSGVPEKIGDVQTITQSIRLPREVVTGKTGLCIELSLLYASVMMCAGMDPIIYLVPGHAYPGFRMNNNYYAIESTGIGGEGTGSIASGQEALQSGMKSLSTFMQQAQAGDPAYMVLDVREAIKNGAIAMELKDDNFLRQKIDELAQSFTSQAVPNTVNTNYPVNTGGNTGGGGNDGGGGNPGDGSGNTGGGANIPSGYKAYNGVVSFAYPGSWRLQKRTQYTLPELQHTYANSNYSLDAEVYKFSGYSSPEQALSYMQQYGMNIGLQLQYQNAGQAGGYQLYSGVTSNQNMAINWVGAFKRSGNNIVALIVGANSNVNGKATATKIFNTLQ